ncbi:MAG TPA: aldehyde dehydrogenase family protein, partial [Polyangiales bacterium]
MDIRALVSQLGVNADRLEGGSMRVHTPIDGSSIATLEPASPDAVEQAIARAHEAFVNVRMLPAPKRGELIRVLGAELRAHKALLAELVSIESGKIRQEALGEVQEMIDICDFAVGLSRQLYGLTIASERPLHRMQEQWHPLGVVAVISAFNFPVAVWAWNFALAIVCGDPVIWKPSEKTPLSALACQALWDRAVARAGVYDGPPLGQIVLGGRAIGEQLVRDPRIALVSATGSCQMGRAVAPLIAARFGRALLELGGNNAMIVAPSADLDLAVRAILFSAVGTAGQRCTSLRRLIVHESVIDRLLPRLVRAYSTVRIGSPLESDTLIGPLIDARAFDAMQLALSSALQQNGALLCGGERVLEERYPDAYYVSPAIVRMPEQSAIVREETFAPLLYALSYRELDDAIASHNAVEQGLSS